MNFEELNLRGDVDKWARLTIKRFKNKQQALKIGKSGKLARSFKQSLQMNGREVTGVTISFDFHGRFVDMGVGRGLAAYERGTNRQNRQAGKRLHAKVEYHDRQPKRWFNKPKMARIYTLREILAGRLNNFTASEVKKGLSGDMEYGIRI